MEEYIGSQQHLEDCINEHYDREEEMNRQMEREINTQIYQQMQEEPMKTAQEILESKGILIKGFNDIDCEPIIEAIEEYASQFSTDLLLCHKCGCNKLHYEGNNVFKCLNIECDSIKSYTYNLDQLKNEIQHIFDSGANEIRVYEMVTRFIDRNIINKRHGQYS